MPVNGRALLFGFWATHCWKGWTQWLLEKLSIESPMSAEADVDRACVRGGCVAFLGSGYADTVREVRKHFLHCVCAQCDVGFDECMCVCVRVGWGLIFYACMYVLFFLVRCLFFF